MTHRLLFALCTAAALPLLAWADGDVSSIPSSDIAGFENFPPAVKKLIENGLKLTRMDLNYKYGSADPANGGMDCSGTISYLLKEDGVPHVPRQANLMYKWVWENTRLFPVISSNPKSFELEQLQPGDLLFWSGTYTIDRDPPVTHVMLYIGKSKKTGKPLMLGASSGRRYEGKPRNGVSVFDFVLPRPKKDGSGPRFVGYGRVPNLPQPPPPKATPATTPAEPKAPATPSVITNSDEAPPRAHPADSS